MSPIGPVPAASYRSLVRDAKLALLSEIGARAVFDHIARGSRDAELGRMAESMNREGIDLVARVQELIREMGGRPRRTSFRRRALARLLVHGAPVLGPRRVLRIVRDAEPTGGAGTPSTPSSSCASATSSVPSRSRSCARPRNDAPWP